MDTGVSRATISGSSSDNVLVVQNRLLVFDSNRNLYWNGSAWTSAWSRFSTGAELNDWSYTLDLPADGSYTVVAYAWDSASNRSGSEVNRIGFVDDVPPVVEINSTDVVSLNTGVSRATISGSSSDNVLVVQNRLLVLDSNRNLYWNGSAWTSTWSRFGPDGELNDWSYTLDLPAGGSYAVVAYAWDSASNRSRSELSRIDVPE